MKLTIEWRTSRCAMACSKRRVADAEAYAAANPQDAVGRETLFHVLTRSGDPRAADVLEAD